MYVIDIMLCSYSSYSQKGGNTIRAEILVRCLPKVLRGSKQVIVDGLVLILLVLGDTLFRDKRNETLSYLYSSISHTGKAESLFTKRTDVLPQDLVKSRSREIGCYNDCIALKFDRNIDSIAAQVSVKFQRDKKSLNPNLAPSRLH